MAFVIHGEHPVVRPTPDAAVGLVAAWVVDLASRIATSDGAPEIGCDVSTWRKKRAARAAPAWDLAEAARLAVLERDTLGTRGLLEVVASIYGGAAPTDPAQAERILRAGVQPLALAIAHIEDRLQNGLSAREAADQDDELTALEARLRALRNACRSRCGRHPLT